MGHLIPQQVVSVPNRLSGQSTTGETGIVLKVFPDSVPYCCIINHSKLSGLKQWFIISHDSFGWPSSVGWFFCWSCPESLMWLQSFDSVTGAGGSKVAHSHIQSLAYQLGLLSLWSLIILSSSPSLLMWCWECWKGMGQEAASLGNRAHTILLLPHVIGPNKTNSGSRNEEIDIKIYIWWEELQGICDHI